MSEVERIYHINFNNGVVKLDSGDVMPISRLKINDYRHPYAVVCGSGNRWYAFRLPEEITQDLQLTEEMGYRFEDDAEGNSWAVRV